MTPQPEETSLNREHEPGDDRVLRTGRREALVVLLIWICALVYTVGYCYLYGYQHPDGTGRTLASLHFIAGFPDWVFWGIVVPWAACFVAGAWFAFGFMTDESLGEDADPQRFEDEFLGEVPHE